MKQDKLLPIKAIFSIIAGLAIIFLFTETVSIAMVIIAIYLIIDGLLEITYSLVEQSGRRSFFAGMISIIAGFLFIINSQFTVAIFVYLIAAKFILESLTHIYHILKEHRLKLDSKLIIELVKNFLILGVSVWLMFQPIGNFATLLRLIGIYAVITGAVHLYQSKDQFKKLLKNFNIGNTFKEMKPYLVSGLGYGLGFLIGTGVTFLIFNFEDEFYLKYFGDSGRFVAGALIIALTIIIQSILAGGLGAWLFSKFSGEKVENKKKLISRVITGLAIAGIVLLVPLLFGLFMVVFHTDSRFGVIQSVLLFSIFGALYGLISSGVQTFKNIDGKRKVDVISFMTVGYTLGGAFLGFAFHNYYFNSSVNYENLEGLLWIVLGVLGFGFAGGVSLYRSLHFLNKDKELVEEEDRKTELSTLWSTFTKSDIFEHRTIKRFFGLMLILIIGVGLTFAYILNRPDLATEIPVKTIGTAWRAAEELETQSFQPSQGNLSELVSANCNNQKLVVKDSDDKDISTKIHDFPNCISSTNIVLFTDSGDDNHMIWASNQVEDVNGNITKTDVIYDAIYRNNEFEDPIIISESKVAKIIGISQNETGDSMLTWDNGSDIRSMILTPYECDTEGMSELTAEAVNVATEFHDGSYPACQNKFISILYTPNPAPEFSDQPPVANSAYDHIADLIANADQEVLITNMWYDQASNADSPGSYLSRGVLALYEKVKANPENYPRGMSVKIMLGNPPEFLLLDTEGQIWNLLNDLRAVGFGDMVQEDLGWKVEVANFGGALPHSHTKQVIIDGDEIVAAGFNLTYKHLPTDHVSEKGGDVVDTALYASGPIAQVSLASFDDMWATADQKHCDNFFPTPEDSWQLTCEDVDSNTDHSAEVLTYKPIVGEDTDTFLSLYRSYNYKEAEDVIANALRNSKKTIDIIQVNFSMDLICDLNVLVEVCDFDRSLEFTKAFVDAMEEEGVKVRIITKGEAIEGLENNVSINVLTKELEKRGLSENIEIRYFDGDFHSKAINIDNEFLVVGSQNFHYSAWGKSGLTEFNLATDSSEAIEEFNNFYNYYWEKAIPVDDK